MFERLLVANRGEIAIRIIRSAGDLGIETVAIAPADDASTRHMSAATSSLVIDGGGPGAYLDIDAVVAAAVTAGCDAVHPGYGFLAENADFAEACGAAGLVFIGPTPHTLRTLGDKRRALDLARSLGVPVAESSDLLDDADAVSEFVERVGPVMLKAAAGGGGRGMRIVRTPDDSGTAFDRCRSEAMSAFGDGALYAERLIERARHIEVQIIGDGAGRVSHLWDRDCSLQRQRQKVVEFAPADSVATDRRERIIGDAVALAEAADHRSLATFEFLVTDTDHLFIEANPRIQVEHTVTEEITGVDLVRAQLEIGAGATLDQLGLADPPMVSGVAVQLRVNAERLEADGSARPVTGTTTRIEFPGGAGVRTDSHATAGHDVSPRYDSLLAKLIVAGPDRPTLFRRAERAIGELVIEGVATNQGVLSRLLDLEAVRNLELHTTLIDEFIVDLADPPSEEISRPAEGSGPSIAAPLLGTVVSIAVAPGDVVHAGDELLVMEAMKMEHVIAAPTGGRVTSIDVRAGDAVGEGAPLVGFLSDGSIEEAAADDSDLDPERIRPDLAESIERHGYGLDENRPDKVARRHGTGKRTARENLADLVDAGSFVEYGPLVLAAQRKRRSVQELIEQTPGDGLIGGIGQINGDEFGDAGQCVVASYDYMVLAGTQGHQNHRKKDRLFEIAHRLQLPVVLFAEGGGGRPGDTDGVQVAGLDCLAFQLFAELSGHVPLVGINGGYCFAGNAALLGCCDVVIATENSNLGMGGPAMIEGGGLGVFHPTEVGPIETQRSNGVVDIVVADEAAAVETAKKYLSYFQGSLSEWEAPDQRLLRHAIPENRLRVYDMHSVIEQLFDLDSVLELRADFGIGMITALARIEGRAVGVIANNPTHLAGAIDADGADKASRFLQLCDAFGLPVVSLCDTPGIMVGPAAEETALVRHAARMFVTSANLSVPMCTVVTRKGYGLGAQAMAAGSFKATIFTVGWPSSEFGGMGLEGFVRLGYRNELDAIEDPDERQAMFETMVAKMYEVGKGVSMADHFEIDDVIDPADTRRWITTAFRSSPPAGAGHRPAGFVDTW
jgi:acetyl/propionyl-CoA carboxylase alpha subunit/acetyl-CoA carboxylase carboxyltransferase component